MVDTLSYFSFQPVLHDWCNKGRGVCYSVCGILHIKEPLLLMVAAGFLSRYLNKYARDVLKIFLRLCSCKVTIVHTVITASNVNYNHKNVPQW